jgi:hypothetical protein
MPLFPKGSANVDSRSCSPVLAWGWHPGLGRDPVPGTQRALGELICAWIDSGAECPWAAEPTYDGRLLRCRGLDLLSSSTLQNRKIPRAHKRAHHQPLDPAADLDLVARSICEIDAGALRHGFGDDELAGVGLTERFDAARGIDGITRRSDRDRAAVTHFAHDGRPASERHSSRLPTDGFRSPNKWNGSRPGVISGRPRQNERGTERLGGSALLCRTRNPTLDGCVGLVLRQSKLSADRHAGEE